MPEALMNTLLREVRGAAAVAFFWAAAWGFAGGIMEAFFDTRGEILDMWIQTLAIPGFVGGLIFFVVFRLAERRRRFEELSMIRFAVWGALSGLLLAALAMAVGFAGGVFPGVAAWVIVAVAVLLSTVAACGLLTVARIANERFRSGALRTLLVRSWASGL